MDEAQYITALVTFLTPEEGGRSGNVHDSPNYLPHLVVGNPEQRIAYTNQTGAVNEDYLGVQFTGDGKELIAGKPYEVTLRLVYLPNVDYSALSPGSTFTIREGPFVVGYGQVVG